MVNEVKDERDRRCWCAGHPQEPEDCPVIREFRQLSTPEGRAIARAEYAAEARARAEGGAESKGKAAYRMSQIGVPALSIMALKHVSPNASIKAALEFIDSGERHFLALIGGPGIGKSVAAAYVLQDFVRRYKWNEQPTGANASPAVYVEAASLTGVTAWEDEHKRQMRAAREARLLVVDDMGNEGTPAGVAALATLLMSRADDRKRTVLTSNLTKAAFVERYGAPLADRLKAVALTPNLQSEKSLRKQAA
jgi:DNA replication protein DnaC